MITAEKARKLFTMTKGFRKLKRRINWGIKYEAKKGNLNNEVLLSTKERILLKSLISYYENLHYKVISNPVRDDYWVTISWEV